MTYLTSPGKEIDQFANEVFFIVQTFFILFYYIILDKFKNMYITK